MTAKQIDTLMAKIVNNGGMITVYRHHTDGTVSAIHYTFRVDSARKVLKKPGRYSVTQK